MDAVRLIAIATLAQVGCFAEVPRPPTAGYGEPYKGTGEGIYVKDSRTDWDVTEGHRKITSEQALEAAGDPEYEARRQIAKSHNDHLYREGHEHHRRAYRMMEASGVAIAVGYIAAFVIAPHLQQESMTSAGIGMPETRTFTSGPATEVVASLGSGLLIAGLVGAPYAYYGGMQTPPYHVWRTPDPLHRPAYVRQQTEPYNEKIGAPTIPDVETGTQPVATPAVDSHLKTKPRHIPHPRGPQ